MGLPLNRVPRLSRRAALRAAAASPLLLGTAWAGSGASTHGEIGMDETNFFQNDEKGLDIVDCQYHLRQGEIETTLRAMDALGIRSLLIDEFWGEFGTDHPTHIQPGYRLANGAWRAAWPTAEQASLLYPERFAYLVRIDRRDPDIESVMRVVAASPHARAFRVQPAWSLEELAAFADGGYDRVLGIAQELGLPVCFFIPGYVELLPPRLKAFPRLTFVVDHCGMGFPGIPAGRAEAEAARTRDASYLDQVFKLAEQPNVALKWSHAQNLLGARTYPYEPLRPLLRQAINAFGKERIMWASDNSVIPNHTWGDILYALRDDPELSATEKEWVLGRAAREILRWPPS